MKKETKQFHPCALCGKRGEVVLTEINADISELETWYRVEVQCPDKCDECGTGEENVIFATTSDAELQDWAENNGFVLANVKAI